MDVLADLLARARAQGAAFAHTTARGPWGVRFERASGLGVHVVVDGAVWLRPEGGEPTLLGPGDVALVAGDLVHALAGDLVTPPVSLDDLVASAAVAGSSRRFEVPGDGPAAVFFCGAYSFTGDLCGQLLASLPDVVVIRTSEGTALHGALRLLAGEMQREQSGQQTVLDRLLDVVLVWLLREHFSDLDTAAPRWFRAQEDRDVGRALALLHTDPARAWTVAALAHDVGLSRAALARRFTALVGAPPLQYLTDWRMALARERLRDSTDTLGQVAAAIGYSEYAFAAAFKREHGIAPGRWRAQAAAAARTPLLARASG